MTVVDFETAKAYLGLVRGDLEPRVTEILRVAQAAIAERVGPLEPEPTTVRVTPDGRTLCVPSPALEVISIIDSNGTTVDVDGLHLDGGPGLITRNDGGSFSARWYDVNLTLGRAADQCPADLVEAVLALTKHLLAPQLGTGARVGASTSEGAANTITGAGYLLPFRVQELIAPYRRPLVG